MFYDRDHYAPEHENTDEFTTCPTCYGDGQTHDEVCIGPDEWETRVHRCPTCKGEGEIPADLDTPHRREW